MSSEMEVVVIDNDSHDETFNLAKNHKIKNTTNKNIYKVLKIKHCTLSESRNTAIGFSSGDYLVFIDADARLSDGFIENLEKNIKVKIPDLVHGKIKNFKNATRISKFLYATLIEPSYYGEEKPFIGAFMGFKRELFDKYYFNAEMKRGDDTLIFREIKKNENTKVLFLNDVFVRNEFPNSIISWIKNIFMEGVSGYYVDKFTNCSSKKKVVLPLIFSMNFLCPLSSIFCIPYLLRVIALMVKNTTCSKFAVKDYMVKTCVLIASIILRDSGYVYGMFRLKKFNCAKKTSTVMEEFEA